MCRLAAYFGPPVSPAHLLFGGSHPLAEQAWAPRELLNGTINADGWGISWAAQGGMVRLARAEPVWYDPDAEPLLRSMRSGSQLAVLRNATPGLPVDRSGMLPRVEEGFAFGLNGFVPDFRPKHMRELRRMLDDARYGKLVGTSDAETLFFLVLQSMEEGADPLAAMAHVRETVRGRLNEEAAPLTMVLAGSEGVWALNSSAGGAVNSLYLGRGVAPMGAGSTVASEPLSEEEWEPVPAHHGVTITQEGARIQRV